MSNALPELVAGRYRLISPLGQGGMGRVWKARDEVLHRDVAIKELVPPPGLSADERREMRERSLREARAIARLNHINAVRVFDVLRTDGDPWIVMEYVASRSLQEVITQDGPMPPKRVAEIGLGMLGALKAAHKAGVMHRDVKPGNVLLGDDGRVVLTDFGLATIPGDPNVTRTGLVLGSPAYIAPERARDGTAGPEADLWSLGATLYAAVEGHSPFARPSAIETLAALATEPLPQPKKAGPLKTALNGLLRKDPAQRIDADTAERLLRKVAGKRTRGAITLLDGVRRPAPVGQGNGATPATLPAPRTAPGAGSNPSAVPAPASPAEVPTAAAEAPPAQRAHQVQTGDPGPGAKVDSASTAVDGAVPTVEVDSASAESTTAHTEAAKTETPKTETPKTEAPAPAPTAAMPSPALAVPERVGVGPKPPGRVPVIAAVPGASDGKRRNLMIAGLVGLLLLALVIIVPMMGDDPVDEANGPKTGSTTGASSSPTSSASSPSVQPSASPSNPLAGAPAIPGGGGWRLYKDPTGFVVPVPANWQVSRKHIDPYGREDYRVYFRDSEGRVLLIDQNSKPQSDAEADWYDLERKTRGTRRDYQRVTIKSVDYWDEAADWEWTQRRDGQIVHIRNRGFVTAPDKGYAIFWEIPADQWEENLPLFDFIAKEFVPVRS